MFPEGRERLRAIALSTAVSIGVGAIGLISAAMLTEWASWRCGAIREVPIGVAVFAIGAGGTA